MNFNDSERLLIGWREWLALPELGLPAIKAKIDTGARTSALHAFQIQVFTENQREMLRFFLHPLQKHSEPVVECVAPVKDRRLVSDSGGHREWRYVIETPCHLADRIWPIEITLTSREDMLFRMLLGRSAMQGQVLLDPSRSYLTGKQLARAYRQKRT